MTDHPQDTHPIRLICRGTPPSSITIRHEGEPPTPVHHVQLCGKGHVEITFAWNYPDAQHQLLSAARAAGFKLGSHTLPRLSFETTNTWGLNSDTMEVMLPETLRNAGLPDDIAQRITQLYQERIIAQEALKDAILAGGHVALTPETRDHMRAALEKSSMQDGVLQRLADFMQARNVDWTSDRDPNQCLQREFREMRRFCEETDICAQKGF